ncbi:MAG: rhodanese-related sulfurtransferase [Hyphomicrobium sp.]
MPIAPAIAAPSCTVSAFYKFAAIGDCAALRAALLDVGAAHAIKGSILIAPEGINATVSGTDENIRALLAWLRADPRFADLVSKQSYCAVDPFQRFKVKIKREIVTFGVPDADPTRAVGTYVAPADWNALISAPDVVVIDTRNAYEVEIGTFAGARDPATSRFSEFPAYVANTLDASRDTRIAMFCTGGIRCEKASAYLISQGFREVYHLEGGILKYLETVAPDESLWRGECFVFDERVALGHGVTVGHHVLCASCGRPVPVEMDRAPPSTQHDGLMCTVCAAAETDAP